MYLKNIVLTVLVLCGAAAAGNLAARHMAQDHGPAFPRIMARAAKIDDVSHRAIYSFKMVSVESGAGISGIDGQMYYQQQDACGAYETEHKFKAEYQYPERPVLRNTSQYVSWEAKDGKTFYFNSDRQENGELVEQLRGNVVQRGDGTMMAEYSRPPALSYLLPKDFVLPMRHTHMLIEKARAGERFFKATLFDGTDGDGPSEINAFIGAKLTPEEIAKIGADNPKVNRGLLTPEAWHIRLAVYPLKDGDEMLPSYEMQMVQHANGVVSHVVVDYRIFKVEQTLTALETLPQKKCSPDMKG